MAKVIWYKLKKGYKDAPKEGVLIFNIADDIWFSQPDGKGGSRVRNPDPQYWEAMYTPIEMEDEIKAGDWVEVLKEDSNYYNSEKCPQLVDKLIGGDMPYRLRFSNEQTNCYAKVRKVKTPINILKTLKIAGYQPAIRRTGVEFGCQVFTLAEVIVLKRIICNKEFTGKITIQGVEITEAIISAILNGINNYKQ